MEQSPDASWLLLAIPIVFIIFMVLLFAAVIGFWIWMIVDVANNEPSGPGNEKVVWLLIVIFLGWIGALVYYFVRRRPRLQKSTGVVVMTPPPIQ